MSANVKAGAPGEWFDVVNDRDQVTGRALRAEVHAQGLLHRAVHVLVFNATGGVFVQQRSMAKDVAPGLWDSSCSGHLDAGEDYDPAARRELGEELGLRLNQPPERWFRILACAATGGEFVWVYRLQAEGPFTLPPEEIERGEWVQPAELWQRMAREPRIFAPAFKLVWAMALQRL
jgi:isopentenyl-diphosphate delta-isomerase type 1